MKSDQGKKSLQEMVHKNKSQLMAKWCGDDSWALRKWKCFEELKLWLTI